MPAEQIDQLQEKAQKELVMVRQRLDEALSQERRAMRCGLIKKRRELISEMVTRTHIFKVLVVTISCGSTSQALVNNTFIPPSFYSHQLSVHKQRQKDLSGLSRALEGTLEVAQNLHCWQNLLTAHSLELAELINNLDEEATADIRKVPFCHIIT